MTSNGYYIVAASNAGPGAKAAADYVCDGIADQVEINAAITAAAAYTNGYVRLCAGQFNTTDSILLTSNVALIGDEDLGTTIIVSNGVNNDVNIFKNANEGVQALNTIVSKLVIDGNRANRAGYNTTAFELTNFAILNIFNVKFQNIKGVGIQCNDYCTQIIANGCSAVAVDTKVSLKTNALVRTGQNSIIFVDSGLQ